MHLGWHFVFETLAYAIGFRLYSRARETDGDTLDTSTRLGIIVACCIGAVIGAKILYLAEDPAHTLRNWSNPAYFFGGKTLVGALIGGTISVEVVKRRAGIRQRTGDLFAIPLAVGIAILLKGWSLS